MTGHLSILPLSHLPGWTEGTAEKTIPWTPHLPQPVLPTAVSLFSTRYQAQCNDSPNVLLIQSRQRPPLPVVECRSHSCYSELPRAAALPRARIQHTRVLGGPQSRRRGCPSHHFCSSLTPLAHPGTGSLGQPMALQHRHHQRTRRRLQDPIAALPDGNAEDRAGRQL